MAEPFSTNDIYYINAQNCSGINTSNGCYTQDTGDKTNCECKYKENVDKLTVLKSMRGLTKKHNDDLNEGQSALIINNISLGIGILGMMWIIYSNSE